MAITFEEVEKYWLEHDEERQAILLDIEDIAMRALANIDINRILPILDRAIAMKAWQDGMALGYYLAKKEDGLLKD